MKYIESLREGERINEIYLCKVKQSELKKEGKSLALLTMEAEVKAYGYEGLDAVEKALSK